MVTIYGIPNCGTVKKARAWLDGRGVAYAFHDYKKAGVDRAVLETVVERLGWETVLNRTGTTFRKLPEELREGLDRDRAVALMLNHPSAIRRPLLVDGNRIEAGFKPERYAALFAAA